MEREKERERRREGKRRREREKEKEKEGKEALFVGNEMHRTVHIGLWSS